MKSSGTFLRALSLLIVLLLVPRPDSRATPTEQPDATGHTRVSLVADVREIRPGTPFTVGVLLRMDKGWHTYWRNPGESGLPTELKWTLPSGFTAGAPAWPLPEKKVEEGDLLTFAYADEVMLLVPVTPPADLVPGTTATVRLDASWLECERTCVPGEGSATLVLPVREGDPVPAHASLFSRYRSLIPVPPGENSPVRFSATVEETAIIVRVSAAQSGHAVIGASSLPDIFPYPVEGLSTGRTTVRMEGNEAVITLPVTSTPDVPQPSQVQGVLVYRDNAGTARGLEISIPLHVQTVAPGAGKGLLDRDFASAGGAEGQPSLWVYALFAVFGGMLLNVMPCVLPVIALKIFGLVKMAGDEPRRVRRLGWAFSAGILASFLVLALIVILLKLAGQQVGWGFQFQEPVFVIIMSAVVFAFGLSLFGVYEIRLPGAAVAGVSSTIARQEGKGSAYLSSFSEGVFATILATPCTAPFLGSALGFAFAQPAGGILLIFGLAAFGMALPYLLLTARPAWLKYLPKPGAWMEAAKQFMGFLMMATLLWLLYILGKQLGMEAVIWTGAFLLAVAVAAWLVGRFATLTASRRQVYLVWLLSAVIAVGGYLYFIESTLDIRAAVAGSPGQQGVQPAGEGIAWEPFSTSGLEAHLRAGKPVFLDFTAEWCLTCKVNERTVLHDPAVMERFRSSGIVAMKADWTNRNPEITRLLSRFGRSGVPLYVVFRTGDAVSPIVLPEVITTGIVLDALDRAVAPGQPAAR
ncbi:MAG: thioredoxin family protein [Ignavibacteriae bacterium]|nr:thioredoxin family protein [Ignavibacteriota bacterium]